MKILVTGCAGFIGYHVCLKLLKNKNFEVYGIDNMNDYYDINLKKSRLKELKNYKKNFFFEKIDISNFSKLKKYANKKKFNCIINLAAQAGVRSSISNPRSYVESNLIGFFNILQLSKIKKIKHLIMASTSSVYGNSKKFPLKEEETTDRPISFYAATKKSNEVMAYSYSYIHKTPITCLRFFTVYGPFGRPDMSLYKFTKLITKNKEIDFYNYGNHIRDFTYIDDISNIVIRLIKKPPKDKIPYKILNIASNKPKKLKFFLGLIEKNLKKKAIINYLPLQLGDVHKTSGDNRKIKKIVKKYKFTNLEDGVKYFIDWYKNFYKK